MHNILRNHQEFCDTFIPFTHSKVLSVVYVRWSATESTILDGTLDANTRRKKFDFLEKSLNFNGGPMNFNGVPLPIMDIMDEKVSVVNIKFTLIFLLTYDFKF